MNNIQELYKEKPELVEKLFEHLSEIKYKLKSESFQIINNEDELEIRKCSENKNEIGYLVGDYERLFSKSINESMNFVENNIENFEKYKFISFENLNNSFFLNYVIDNDNNLIDINEAAKELNMEVLSNLFNEELSYDDFVNLITSSDIDNFINESVNKEDISGLVFSFNIDNKIAEYELSVSENNINESVNRKDDSNFLSELYEFYNQWSEENVITESDNRLESIQKNFINMMSDYKVYSKLMNIGSKINLNESIQIDRCCDEAKKEIKKYGSIYKNLLEHYIKLFYYTNENNLEITEKFCDYIVNEDLSKEDMVKEIIDKLKKHNISLKIIKSIYVELKTEKLNSAEVNNFFKNKNLKENQIKSVKQCIKNHDLVDEFIENCIKSNGIDILDIIKEGNLNLLYKLYNKNFIDVLSEIKDAGGQNVGKYEICFSVLCGNTKMNDSATGDIKINDKSTEVKSNIFIPWNNQKTKKVKPNKISFYGALFAAANKYMADNSELKQKYIIPRRTELPDTENFEFNINQRNKNNELNKIGEIADDLPIFSRGFYKENSELIKIFGEISNNIPNNEKIDVCKTIISSAFSNLDKNLIDFTSKKLSETFTPENLFKLLATIALYYYRISENFEQLLYISKNGIIIFITTEDFANIESLWNKIDKYFRPTPWGKVEDDRVVVPKLELKK